MLIITIKTLYASIVVSYSVLPVVRRPRKITNCWAHKRNTPQLPSLFASTTKFGKYSVMFVPLDEMFDHHSLLESTFVYCTCIEIHTKPELCLFSDVVLWPGALFFTRGWQIMAQCPKLSNHLYMERISQDALVFAIYILKVCNLQASKSLQSCQWFDEAVFRCSSASS